MTALNCAHARFMTHRYESLTPPATASRFMDGLGKGLGQAISGGSRIEDGARCKQVPPAPLSQ